MNTDAEPGECTENMAHLAGRFERHAQVKQSGVVSALGVFTSSAWLGWFLVVIAKGSSKSNEF